MAVLWQSLFLCRQGTIDEPSVRAHACTKVLRFAGLFIGDSVVGVGMYLFTSQFGIFREDSCRDDIMFEVNKIPELWSMRLI